MVPLNQLTRETILSKEVLTEVFDQEDELYKAELLASLGLRAAELKVKTEFKDLVAAYKRVERDMKKQTVSNDISLLDNWTNFSGPYDNMKCKTWIASDDGIYQYNPNPMAPDLLACYHPILPVERFKNLETGEEQIKIAFKRSGRWEEIIVPKTLITSASKIVALSSRGVAVTSENAKSRPEAFDRPQDAEIFKEAIKAVNDSAARSAESEKQAEGWAHGREDLPERGQDNAKYYAGKTEKDAEKTATDRKEVERLVESVSGISEQVTKVENLTKQAQTSATNAALSEQATKESENNAAQSRAGAEVAENNAQLAAQKAEQDKLIVEQAKNLVKQMGQEVLDNKNLVDKTAQDFDLKAQQALADVNNAGHAQTERVQTAGNDAVESVKAAQGTATRAVETAKTEAIEAVQTEGTTQAGNVSAEGEKQVQAVRGAAQEIVADRGQIQENKTGIAKLKEDIVGLDNRKADAIVETASGTPLDVTDSAKLPIQNLRVFGKSEQNGVPSLDAPIPIVNVGEKGNVDIKINTGNLFDINAVKKYEVDNTTLSLLVSGNKIIFNSKISTGKEAIMNVLGKNNDAIKLPLGKYILSYKSNKPFGSTNGTDTVEMYACVRTGDSTVYRSTGTKNYVIFEIKEGDELFLRFDINKSGQSAEFYDIMLNRGEIALPYGPYFNQSLTLSTPNGLLGIKVDSGGNYTDANGQQWICDEIDLARGKYIQRIEKKIIKDMNLKYLGKTVEGNCKFFIEIEQYDTDIYIQRNIPSLCDIFKLGTSKNKFSYSTLYTSDWKGMSRVNFIVDESINTIEEFKKLVGEARFYYKLKEQIERDLPPETTEAFKSLYTNYPSTVISNDENAGMEVSYVADTKHYIDKKFEELNQAIVNTQIALL